MRAPAATVSEPALRSPIITPLCSKSTREAFSTLPSSSPAIVTLSARTPPVSLAPASIGEIALDVDVALELAGDADAAAAFDLAFDRDVGGDQRFLAGQARLLGACDRRSRRAGGARSGVAGGGGARTRASTERRAGPVRSGVGVCREAVLSFQKAMAWVLSRVQMFEASAKRGRRQSIRRRRAGARSPLPKDASHAR